MAADKEKAIIEIILKGQQANASIKDIEKSARALRSQMNQLPIDSQAFAEKSKEFQKVDARLRAVNKEVRGLSGSFKQVAADQTTMLDKFKLGVAAVFGGNILTSAVRRIGAVFSDAIALQRDFEKSLKNLSAITGASGKDLDFYKERAIDMSKSVKGGAVAVVEAFKLIGSAKPELLENKEALAEVTRQAILLSQAAGLDLPEASLKLTDAMNQFSAPASEAAKYVDALAAGAKYGASEVPEVTDALLKFGVAAKSSNINIYESVAAIELLGEKGLKGAEAGTQLRNVFAKLSAASILPPETLNALKAAGVNISVLSDKTVPLQTRLKELSKIQGDAATITKVFGLESKNAGEALISNLDRLEKLTEQVKESGVATQQAAVNMDTLDQATLEAKNEWDAMMLSFTSGDFGEVIKGFVKKATEGLGSLKNTISSIGTLMNSGSLFKASDAMASSQMGSLIKKTVSQMSQETRMEILKQEREETEVMIRTLKNFQWHNKFQVEDKAKSIQQKIALVKELEKYEAKALSDATADNKAKSDEAVAISAEEKGKLIEEHKRYLDELAKLEQDQRLAKMDTDAREMEMLSIKYKELADKAKGNKADLKRVQALYEDDIMTLMMKQFEKIAVAETKAFDERLKRYRDLKTQKDTIENTPASSADLTPAEKAKKETDDLQLQWDERIQSAKNYNATLYADELQFTIDIAALESAKNADLERLNEAHLKTIDQQNKDANLKKINDFQKAYQTTAQITDTIMAANNQAANREIAENQRTADSQIAAQKKLLDKKVISQAEYEKRIAKIEEQKLEKDRKLKREQAERDKTYGIFKILLNTAIGVTRALAEENLYEAIAVGALGAAELAVAASVPIPEYAEGGLHTGDKAAGFVDKPTLFSNSASGQPFIAGEAGAEWIAPNWMLQDPYTANTIKVLEGIRQRGYAGGGLTSEPSGTGKKSSSETTQFVQANNGDLVSVLSTLKQVLENGIIAHMSYDDFTKTQNSIESARADAQVRN